MTLWSLCRSGLGGYAHWPDAAGVAEQSSWLLDAFAIIADQYEKIPK